MQQAGTHASVVQMQRGIPGDRPMVSLPMSSLHTRMRAIPHICMPRVLLMIALHVRCGCATRIVCGPPSLADRICVVALLCGASLDCLKPPICVPLNVWCPVVIPIGPYIVSKPSHHCNQVSFIPTGVHTKPLVIHQLVCPATRPTPHPTHRPTPHPANDRYLRRAASPQCNACMDSLHCHVVPSPGWASNCDGSARVSGNGGGRNHGSTVAPPPHRLLQF